MIRIRSESERIRIGVLDNAPQRLGMQRQGLRVHVVRDCSPIADVCEAAERQRQKVGLDAVIVPCLQDEPRRAGAEARNPERRVDEPVPRIPSGPRPVRGRL